MFSQSAFTLAALVGFFAASIQAQAASMAGNSQTQIETVPFNPAQWTLVWADEFNQAGAPNPETWKREVGYLRNGEKQYYTADRPENARVENGNLVIEARRDDWEGKPITSASLITRGLRSFLYGRIEVRAKLPTGRGTWPAIWTLGENVREAGWPACGEIDIMENVGFDPDLIHANIHCKDYNHMKGNGRGARIKAPSTSSEFHIYAVEWHENRLEFYYDDTRYFVYENELTGTDAWPFAQPHYLILNLAIGGGWGGQQGIDESRFPHRFEIDYVRYYKPVTNR